MGRVYLLLLHPDLGLHNLGLPRPLAQTESLDKCQPALVLRVCSHGQGKPSFWISSELKLAELFVSSAAYTDAF